MVRFNDYFPFCLTFGGRGGTLGWAVGGNRPPLPTIRRYKRAYAHEAPRIPLRGVECSASLASFPASCQQAGRGQPRIPWGEWNVLRCWRHFRRLVNRSGVFLPSDLSRMCARRLEICACACTLRAYACACMLIDADIFLHILQPPLHKGITWRTKNNWARYYII